MIVGWWDRVVKLTNTHWQPEVWRISMDNQFKIEIDGDIAWIINSKPEVLNAVRNETWDELNDILDELDKNESVRAAVLAGDGKAFCAGANVKEMAEHVELFATGDLRDVVLRRWQNALQNSTRKIRGLRIPVIAAVHGYAVGAGLELCCACDLVVAEEGTLMGFPEATVGVTVTNGGTFYCSRLFGLSKAREMAYTGKFIDVEEAYRLGAICKIVPKGEGRNAAKELADDIAAQAPTAVTLHKRMFDRGLEISLEASLVYETESLITTARGADHAEGAKAFVEKRKPQFTGR
jgi:enoyl-CoA hydratase/carnithine racemase